MLEEFRSSSSWYKLSAIASWLLIPALIVFGVSSLVVGTCFITGTQPRELTKKAFLLGLGTSTGLFMISCGALLEDDRREEERLKKLDPKIDNYRCKTCKYYSWSRALPCAVQPTIALTEQASQCADWAKR